MANSGIVVKNTAYNNGHGESVLHTAALPAHNFEAPFSVDRAMVHSWRHSSMVAKDGE